MLSQLQIYFKYIFTFKLQFLSRAHIFYLHLSRNSDFIEQKIKKIERKKRRKFVTNISNILQAPPTQITDYFVSEHSIPHFNVNLTNFK